MEMQRVRHDWATKLNWEFYLVEPKGSFLKIIIFWLKMGQKKPCPSLTDGWLAVSLVIILEKEMWTGTPLRPVKFGPYIVWKMGKLHTKYVFPASVKMGNSGSTLPRSPMELVSWRSVRMLCVDQDILFSLPTVPGSVSDVTCSLVHSLLLPAWRDRLLLLSR